MIDEIWASMNAEQEETKKVIAKKKKTLVKSDIVLEVPAKPQEDVMTLLSSMGIAKPSTKKKSSEKKKESTAIPSASPEVESSPSQTPQDPLSPISATAADMIAILARPIDQLNNSSAIQRKAGIQHIHSTLKCLCVSDNAAITAHDSGNTPTLSSQSSAACTHILTRGEFTKLSNDIYRPVLKRLVDDSDAVREVAHSVCALLFANTRDAGVICGYFFPLLMSRISADIFYDTDMKVFVSNPADHEAYKRGRAVSRQDKFVSTVVEPREEIRLQSLRTLCTLIDTLEKNQAASLLHPYLEDVFLFTQAHVLDAAPEVSCMACQLLQRMCDMKDLEVGLKFYSHALARVVFALAQHKLSRVRLSCLITLRALLGIKDYAKRKSACSECLLELVGYREENVLPVAAFYTQSVEMNYMALLAQDKNVAVREEVCRFLRFVMVEMEDRRDYESRFLPYLLDLCVDEVSGVHAAAYAILQQCGAMYEEEHREDILAYKQYAVDGSAHMNVARLLPAPFYGRRPRLGIRLYVRGNCKRFLSAVLNELTAWQEHTRLKSIRLVMLLVVLCEEHLTIDTYTIIPLLLKAYYTTIQETPITIHQQAPTTSTHHTPAPTSTHHAPAELVYGFLTVFELLGRYIHPDTYVYYLVCRLANEGDGVVNPYTDHTYTWCVAHMLVMMVYGSKGEFVAPHLDALVKAFTDQHVLPLDSGVLGNMGLFAPLILMLSIANPSNSSAADVGKGDDTPYTTVLNPTFQPGFRHHPKDIFSNIVCNIIDGHATASASPFLTHTHTHTIHTHIHSALYAKTGRIKEFHQSLARLLRNFLAHLSGTMGARALQGIRLCYLLADPAHDKFETFFSFYGSALLGLLCADTSVYGASVPITTTPASAVISLDFGFSYEIDEDFSVSSPAFQFLFHLAHIVHMSPALAPLRSALLSYVISLVAALLDVPVSMSSSMSTALLQPHLALLEALLSPMGVQSYVPLLVLVTPRVSGDAHSVVDASASVADAALSKLLHSVLSHPRLYTGSLTLHALRLASIVFGLPDVHTSLPALVLPLPYPSSPPSTSTTTQPGPMASTALASASSLAPRLLALLRRGEGAGLWQGLARGGLGIGDDALRAHTLAVLTALIESTTTPLPAIKLPLVALSADFQALARAVLPCVVKEGLLLLDAGSDAVREGGLSLLSATLPLLNQQIEWPGMFGAVLKHYREEGQRVDKLAEGQESVDNNDDSGYLDRLDGLLRSLCLFDLTASEEGLRKELEGLGPRDWSDAGGISGRLQDLLSHVDLLRSLPQ